ncbi:MAG: DUF4920 domain-containing protein [Gemmatimonadetes bacterium]|nr:MAG: DUF4920 domain-containing protein [Gemmatimonadota bacterium]
MKRLFVLTLTVLWGFLCIHQAMAADKRTFGEELTLTEETPISEITENPEAYLGKRVLVKGTVVGVCAKRGCWINLASDNDYETLRVKVTDGEIVFPMDIKGHEAWVEGELYKLEFDKDGNLITNTSDDPHVCSNHQHKEGESCDADGGTKAETDAEKTETSAESKSEVAEVIYQLKGIGAVVQD